MVELESVWCKNLVVFDQARLKLNAAPLTVVRGRNLDKRSGNTKKSANRVGKSLLFSLLPTVRYFAPPTAVKKNSAKDMHRAGSEAGIRLRANGKTYDVLQKTKGKSVALEISENGKLMKFVKKGGGKRGSKTEGGALGFLSSLLPMSEEAFYSLAYIDARRSHPLHRGTDAQRFAFFEDLFRLDIYDFVFKELTAEYNRLKGDVAQLQTLEGEFSERSGEMPKVPLSKLRSRKALHVKNAKTLQSKVERRLRELQHLSLYMRMAKGLDGIKLHEVAEKLKELRSDAKFLQKQYEDALSEEKKRESQAEIQTRRDKLLKRLKAFEADYDKDALEIAFEASRKVADRCRADHDKAVADATAIADVEARITALGLSKKSRLKADKYTSKLLRAAVIREKDRIRSFEESRDALNHKHDAKECPVCRAQLDPKIIKKIVAECEDGITRCRGRIKTLRAYADYRELRDERAVLGDLPDVTALEAARNKAVKKQKQLQSELEMARTQHELRARLESLPTIKSDKRVNGLGGKPSSDTFSVSLDKVRSEIQQLEVVSERLRELDALEVKYASYGEAKARHDTLQGFVGKFKPLLDKALDGINTYGSQLAKAESITADLERLSARIGTLKKSDEDFKLYDALRRAYGAKGLRKLRTRELAKALEDNLNDFAHLIFGEPITFTLNVTDSRFDVLAARNGNPPADVRSLSGAESRCFVLLLYLALIPFIPAHKRVNVLILDEIEANMDEHSRDLFVQEFLPKLMQIVPHVYIITPQSSTAFNIPGARTITVVKKNGRSKLETAASIKEAA